MSPRLHDHRFFKPSDEKTYIKARKRLGRIPSDEVLRWLDTVTVAGWQALEAYGKDADPAALAEARMGALSVLAGIDVLESRVPA